MKPRYASLLLVIVAVVLSPALPATGSAQSADHVELTINTWLCSSEFDRRGYDFAAECQHTPQPGAGLELSEPTGAGNPNPDSATGVTDESGTQIFAGPWIGEGTYTLDLDPASLNQVGAPIVDYVVGCSTGDDLIDVTDYGTSGVLLDLPAGVTAVVCNWYLIPEGTGTVGTVTIDGTPGAELGATFGPTGESVTITFDQNGRATIDTPAPSTNLELETGYQTIECTSDGEQPDPVDPPLPWQHQQAETTTIDVMGGDTVNCTWELPA